MLPSGPRIAHTNHPRSRLSTWTTRESGQSSFKWLRQSRLASPSPSSYHTYTSTKQILHGLSGGETAKLEHTRKVDTERRRFGEGVGGARRGVEAQICQRRRRKTHTLGSEGGRRGAQEARGTAAPRGHQTLEPGSSSRRRPSRRLTPPSKGSRPPGARRGGRASGERGSGPGERRGPGPSYPCRPRARRRLWSRQSSRSAAPASEEFRTVRYLLKAAMALPARRSRGRGRSGDCFSTGSAGQTGRRRARGARAVLAAQDRPLPERAGAHLGLWLRGSAHGGAAATGRVPGCALRTRGPQGGRERAAAATPLTFGGWLVATLLPLLSPPLPSPPLPPPRAPPLHHAQFYRNWKCGPGLRQEFDETCLSIPSSAPLPPF